METQEFAIINQDELKNSAEKLSSYNQSLYNSANNLESIINQINANWENAKGEDCQSAIDVLTKIVANIHDEIVPILRKYVDTLYQIITETETTQSKTL